MEVEHIGGEATLTRAREDYRISDRDGLRQRRAFDEEDAPPVDVGLDAHREEKSIVTQCYNVGNTLNCCIVPLKKKMNNAVFRFRFEEEDTPSSTVGVGSDVLREDKSHGSDAHNSQRGKRQTEAEPPFLNRGNLQLNSGKGDPFLPVELRAPTSFVPVRTGERGLESCREYTAAEKYSQALDILQSGALVQLKHGQAAATAASYSVLNGIPTAVVADLIMVLTSSNLDYVRTIYKAFPRIPIPQDLEGDDDDEMHKLSEALAAARILIDPFKDALVWKFPPKISPKPLGQIIQVQCITADIMVKKMAIHRGGRHSAWDFLSEKMKWEWHGAWESCRYEQLEWSIEFRAPQNGSPQLHDMLAEYLYSESPEMDMAKVSSHFVRGEDSTKFASVLVNFMGKCYPGEDDVAIARGVLLYLSQGNLKEANNLVDNVKLQLNEKQLELPKTDLIQFIEYLLQT
ncbi:hypothetical protein ZIOFF_035543 [Zingiber officinale]|uniref:Uncharacterized protein n=1 Tax=Zingiber officinale TaxID=94328 RepID=A0A8J5L2R1_ZINOF|nr:hypothetical protein ZIOFF_035543 [Zingiber officinale]